LRTSSGREIYGERKSTIEPAFGTIKQILGFRQFLLHGIRKVKAEWKIVTTAYNLKKMHKHCASHYSLPNSVQVTGVGEQRNRKLA
jgi:hypothetical protein